MMKIELTGWQVETLLEHLRSVEQEERKKIRRWDSHEAKRYFQNQLDELVEVISEIERQMEDQR